MAGLCESGNEPPVNYSTTGLNLTNDINKAPLMKQLSQEIMGLPLFALTLRAWFIDVVSADKRTPLCSSELIQSAPQAVDQHYTRCCLVNCPKTGLNLISDTEKAPLMRQLGQDNK
ncbi:hypothetical protein ANN_18570 [Periplaneta americana]|uniref:Uncharacterized protein n=1 Tax=Periplaneta americana TaxID=6978 RepID=A0ABQ8SQH0_PERAM|nr:hypothetical protein ANN_18570 [Periplaneta americana]